MKLIIAGGRTFRDAPGLYRTMIKFLDPRIPEITQIVSGHQMSIDPDTGERYGADYLGECWAKDHGVPIVLFPADWNKLGKRAGFVRNHAMAIYSDAAVVFWDGESHGSKNMIDLMLKENKPVYVASYKNGKIDAQKETNF